MQIIGLDFFFANYEKYDSFGGSSNNYNNNNIAEWKILIFIFHIQYFH